MASRPNHPVLDELLDPIGQCLTPAVAARITRLRAAPRLQARLDRLAERNAEGRLTPRQDAEYDAIVEALDVVAILQAKARRLLKRSRHAR